MVKLTIILISFIIILGACSVNTLEGHLKAASKKARKYKTKDEAAFHYETALKIDSLNIEAYNGLGALYMNRQNDIIKLNYSRNNFLKSLNIEDSQPLIWYQLAYTYKLESGTMSIEDTIKVYQNKLDTAIFYLSKAIKLDPFNHLFYYDRGFCKHYSFDTTGTIADFKKACDLGYSTGCTVIENIKNK